MNSKPLSFFVLKYFLDFLQFIQIKCRGLLIQHAFYTNQKNRNRVKWIISIFFLFIYLKWIEFSIPLQQVPLTQCGREIRDNYRRFVVIWILFWREICFNNFCQHVTTHLPKNEKSVVKRVDPYACYIDLRLFRSVMYQIRELVSNFGA